MSKSRHSSTPYYAFIQALYWAVYCLMVGFASAFLQDKGFTNGQIGLTLGMSYLFSAIMQPIVGSLFSRWKLKLNYAIAFTYIPVVLISLCAFLLPLGRIELMALMAIIFTIQSMMQPSVNTLYRNFETEDKKVNFSLARGVGSAAYAMSSFIMGRLLAWFSPGFIPAVYCTLSIILIASLLFAPTTEDIKEAGTIKQSGSYTDIVKQYPMILLFLLGTGCMYLDHTGRTDRHHTWRTDDGSHRGTPVFDGGRTVRSMRHRAPDHIARTCTEAHNRLEKQLLSIIAKSSQLHCAAGCFFFLCPQMITTTFPKASPLSR